MRANTITSLALGLVIGAAGTAVAARAVANQTLAPGGIVQHDTEVSKTESGPHNGGGKTTGYSFFANVPDLKLVFRKRALKAGSGIGYHLQKEDEIYYVLSGTGEMTIDGRKIAMTPGTAVLTRPGSSHGLKQTGKDDLVILINYEQAPKSR